VHGSNADPHLYMDRPRSLAFEDTLRALKLVDRKDQLTITVAKLIIEFAKQGERHPVRLLALKTLRPD
jgi:hypothetical protein